MAGDGPDSAKRQIVLPETTALVVIGGLDLLTTIYLLATHQVLTGMVIPGGRFDQVASRGDWPCYAGALDYLKPRTDGVPNGVALPSFLMQGPLVWPGQHAGFLGARHDPWHIKQDPNQPDFKVDSIRTEDGAEVDLLFERAGKVEMAIEIKRSSAPEVSKGFHSARDAFRPREVYVLHGGTET